MKRIEVVLLIAVLSCILWIIFGGKYGLEQGILSVILCFLLEREIYLFL